VNSTEDLRHTRETCMPYDKTQASDSLSCDKTYLIGICDIPATRHTCLWKQVCIVLEVQERHVCLDCMEASQFNLKLRSAVIVDSKLTLVITEKFKNSKVTLI